MYKKNLSEIIIDIFKNRAPNRLSLDLIYYELPDNEKDEIDKSVDHLVSKKILIKEDKTYELTSYQNIPIRETITIGDTEVRRILQTDPILPEAINIPIENLSVYANSLEKRFEKIISKKLESYWANIIILFGIFIGIFSLIITAITKISIDSNWGLCDIFLKNLMQVLPISVVLIIFVVLLKLMFR